MQDLQLNGTKTGTRSHQGHTGLPTLLATGSSLHDTSNVGGDASAGEANVFRPEGCIPEAVGRGGVAAVCPPRVVERGGPFGAQCE